MDEKSEEIRFFVSCETFVCSFLLMYFIFPLFWVMCTVDESVSGGGEVV